MKPVNIVTIKNKRPLFKEGEEAHSIELLEFVENGFKVVAQKNLYEIGDKVCYIQWDNCIPDNELFSSFRVPKNRRVRAVKFNFTEENSDDVVYSVGITLPIKEVLSFYPELNEDNIFDEQTDLAEIIGVYKYVEPETMKSGLAKGDLPAGMYKTDEENIENVVNTIEFPVTLYGSVKIDGSSTTVYTRKVEDELIGGICSRGLEKKLDGTIVTGYVDSDGNKFTKFFNKDLKKRGWTNEDRSIFFEDDAKELESMETIEEHVEDSFVTLGRPILEKLLKYCKDNNRELVVRSEIAGEGLKGSGNKNNPHAKLKQFIAAFGIDDYSTGITKRIPTSEFYEICKELDIQTTDLIFHKTFNSLEELRKECEDYFKDNLIEGIVLRDETGKLSVKYMNNLYDSSK